MDPHTVQAPFTSPMAPSRPSAAKAARWWPRLRRQGTFFVLGLVGSITVFPLSGGQPCRVSLMRPDSVAVLPDGRLVVFDLGQGIVFQVGKDDTATECSRMSWAKKRSKDVHSQYVGSHASSQVAVSQDGELAREDGGVIHLIRPETTTRAITHGFPRKDKHTFPFLKGLAYAGPSTLWALTSETLDTFLHPVSQGPAPEPIKIQKPLGCIPSGLYPHPSGGFLSLPYREHCIWMISPKGEVTRFAGQFGMAGSQGGDRLEASFRFPKGIAALPDGTVYVADTWNHVIRRIAPSGQVTVFAGKLGEAGTEDGAAEDARFCLPAAMAAAPDGSVYVLDAWTHAVRKIFPDGLVRTVVACEAAHQPWKKLPPFLNDADRMLWLSIWWDHLEALRVDEACDLMLPAILGMTDRRGRIHSFSTAPGWDDDLDRLCHALEELHVGMPPQDREEATRPVTECLKRRRLVNGKGEPLVDEIPSTDRDPLAAEIKAILTKRYAGKPLHRMWSNPPSKK